MTRSKNWKQYFIMRYGPKIILCSMVSKKEKKNISYTIATLENFNFCGILQESIFEHYRLDIL